MPPRSQAYDSHGPDVRIRGNAPQVYEKYLSLARDATSSGDRVAAESYYQFAEHYFRIMNDSTDPQRQSQPRPRPDGEQPVASREVADREQPHVEWPTTPEQDARPAEPKPASGTEASASGTEAQPEAGAEPETSNSEDKPSRPAPKTRQRTRRRAANGSEPAAGQRAKRRDDGAEEPAAAEAAEDEPAEDNKENGAAPEGATPR